MCGIFSRWGLPLTHADRAGIDRAVHSLVPRGPDEQHIWISEDQQLVLAHTRLGITGQHGAQPIWNKERTVAVLVNGQFYDDRLLKQQCQSLGFEFSTDCDSEILLALYEQHGYDALEFLEGEFAFVLWDTMAQRLWAVRDRCGVKPLKYIISDQQLVLASESKALFEFGHMAQWNINALAQSLTCQYHDPEQTLFEGVHQLAPGQSIVFSRTPQGAWVVDKKTWWKWFDTPADRLRYVSAEGAQEELHAMLQQAVKRRVDTSWPVAVHLSGGSDSTAILHHAQAANAPSLRAFCVGFEQTSSDITHDETHFARQTAAQQDVPLDVVSVTRQDIIDHWDDAIARCEQIAINGHLVGKWMLSRHIHQQGYRISLSGEGADEALLGYPFLTAQHNPMAAHGAHHANRVSVGLMLPDHNEVDGSAIANVWGEIPVWLHAKLSMAWKIHGLLDDQFLHDVIPNALSNWSARTKSSFSSHSLMVHRSASSWAHLALGGYILPALADAPEAGFHIQGRVPFLDSDLLDVVTSWRPSVSNTLQETKAPLRALLRQAGLSHIADRPKHPFQSPPLLGDAAIRSHLMDMWSSPSAWEGTPVSTAKVQQWMNAWAQWDDVQYQAWEPVVCTLLSIHSLNRFMKGRAP